MVGAGAGLSTSAGYEYGGERFRRLFWHMTLRRPAARYAWLDTSPDMLPDALVPRSLHLRADIGATLAAIREERR